MNAVKLPFGSYLIWNDDKLKFATSSYYWGNIHKAVVFSSPRKAEEWYAKKPEPGHRVVNQYEAVRLHYASRCREDREYENCRPAIAYLHGESLDGRGSRIGNHVTFMVNQEDHLFFPDLRVGEFVQFAVEPKTGSIHEVSPCVKSV